MTIILSMLVFVFGVITWLPFLNNVYGQDIAGAICCLDRCRRQGDNPYRGMANIAVGHFFHLWILMRLFGKYSTGAFYGFMCLYNSLSSLVLFWVLAHLFGALPAVIGAMLLSLYIVSPRLDGNWGPFEQLLPLPLFAGILCILHLDPNGSSFPALFAGCLLGYAVLVKQVAVLYLPGFLIMVLGRGDWIYQSLSFLGGFLIANLIPLLYYWIRHDAFWDYLASTWLFQLPSAVNPKKYNALYPKFYVRGEIKQNRKQIIIHHSRSFLPLLYLAFIGTFILLYDRFSLLSVGLVLCLFSSFLMIRMRGTFFPHYWLNTVPWLALLAGIGMSEIIQNSIRMGHPTALSIAGLLAILILFIDAAIADKKYYPLSGDPYQFLRQVWGENLVERYKLWKRIGEYIRDTTKPDDRIMVCGNAPHILLHSDRTHFTKQDLLYAEDYFTLYRQDNPNFLEFLNEIFGFKRLRIIRESKNEFHEGYPEIIVLEEGKPQIEGFESLAAIKYSLDEGAGGFPVYRADRELTELMSCYEKDCQRADQGLEHGSPTPSEVVGSMAEEGLQDRCSRLKEALRKEPRNGHWLLQLGDCMIESKKHGLLFNFYKRLIEQDLVDHEVKLRLLNKVSESYCHQEKMDRAEQVIRDVLRIDPKNVTAFNNLGVIRFNQMKREEARGYFQRVLEIDPHNEDALANLGAMAA